MAKEVAIRGYQCEKCGATYAFEGQADYCCKEYHCRRCGCKTPKGWLICDKCNEEEKYEKAIKMTYDEYIKEYGDNMVVFGDDYYSDIEDVIDYCESYEIDTPKYVWGTKKYRAEIDGERIEEWTLDNTFEDTEFSKDGRAELHLFIEEWNKKYGLDYYCENNKIAVIVPDEMLIK